MRISSEELLESDAEKTKVGCGCTACQAGHECEEEEEEQLAARAFSARRLSPASVLALQRLAGNSAVTGLVGRLPRSIHRQEAEADEDDRFFEAQSFFSTTPPDVHDCAETGFAGPPGTWCRDDSTGALCVINESGNPICRGGTVEAPPAVGGGAGGSTLRKGSRGDAVVSLQQRLNATHVPLVEDGNFDDATRGEAIHFQAVNDLTPDGVVGPKTQAALDAAG